MAKVIQVEQPPTHLARWVPSTAGQGYKNHSTLRNTKVKNDPFESVISAHSGTLIYLSHMTKPSPAIHLLPQRASQESAALE